MELSDVQAQLEQVLLTKQDAERKAMDAARQNLDFQSQLEEANDEILDVMKKYKASVQQASVDQPSPLPTLPLRLRGRRAHGL